MPLINSDLVKIFRTFIMNNIDEESLKADVSEIRDSNPDLSANELCGILINRTAATAALSGAVTGAIPWPLTLLFAVPDFAAVMICQTRMILKLAILAGKDPSSDDRFTEIAACIGVAAGAAAGTVGVRKLIDCGLSPFMLSLILRSFAKSFGSKLIPIAGAVSGGAINYAATVAAGNVAKGLYFPDAEITDIKDGHENAGEQEKASESSEDSEAEEPDEYGTEDNEAKEDDSELKFDNDPPKTDADSACVGDAGNCGDGDETGTEGE